MIMVIMRMWFESLIIWDDDTGFFSFVAYGTEVFISAHLHRDAHILTNTASLLSLPYNV